MQRSDILNNTSTLSHFSSNVSQFSCQILGNLFRDPNQVLWPSIPTPKVFRDHCRLWDNHLDNSTRFALLSGKHEALECNFERPYSHHRPIYSSHHTHWGIIRTCYLIHFILWTITKLPVSSFLHLS